MEKTDAYCGEKSLTGFGEIMGAMQKYESGFTRNTRVRRNSEDKIETEREYYESLGLETPKGNKAFQNPDDQDIAEVFMQMLDVDHDDKLDFAEYLLLVLKMAKAYYEASKDERFQTHGSKRRSKHDYKGLEEEGEEGEEESLRQKHGGTDGKRKGDRTRSPNGRRGKRHGSNSRNEGRDTHRRETEKHKHQHDSNRKQRAGSDSTERKDNRSKKHRQPKDKNYDEIYDNRKCNEDWEASYNHCYYISENVTLEQKEGSRRNRTGSQSKPESSHHQGVPRGSEGGRQPSRAEPSPESVGHDRSSASQLPTHRGLPLSGLLRSRSGPCCRWPDSR
ncbi:filaggrin-like [Mus pahari]|uniref:filaggrin-like n=1 Tax=Mus pahari TaxID=10093 RepID=UPI000A307FC6|nr:filaggrin-like [Mus pahari]